LVIETLGSFNHSALEFLSQLGRRMSFIGDDRRESTFLFQRQSICVQLLNLTAFKDIILTNHEDEAWASKQIYCFL